METSKSRDEAPSSAPDLPATDRRRALKHLGLAAGMLYLAPTLSALSGAQAQNEDKEGTGGPNWKKPSKPVKPSKPDKPTKPGKDG